MSNYVLAFDVGATKTTWATVDAEATVIDKGVFPTVTERAGFLDSIRSVIETYQECAAVGIGIAGVVSPDHRNTFVCSNIPGLSYLEIAEFVESSSGKKCLIDNDARTALIAEVWKGAAEGKRSAIMLTLGTGVGGAVLQLGEVLPHPTDLSEEISRFVVDSSDLYETRTGRGTVETLLGGRALEERYGVDIAEMAKLAHKNDAEAMEFWKIVQNNFKKTLDALHGAFGMKLVILGGHGAKDLDLYFTGEGPCPVVAATFGEMAGVMGAARIALDIMDHEDRDWDE